MDNDVADGTAPYAGAWLDRAGPQRAEPGWIEEQRSRPGTRVIPLWKSRCLVTAGERPQPVRLTGKPAAQVLDAAKQVVFLGQDPVGEPVFAADLSGLAEEEAIALADADAVLDVRAMAAWLDPGELAIHGYARGMLHWHHVCQHCGRCGDGTESRADGYVRTCVSCKTEFYAHIQPAVIVVVEPPGDPDRILLARHVGAGPDGFSLLAGFVDVGESLEDAVRREVAEETGVQVGDVAYVASQPWPFPAGLMIGFRARALTEEITVDPAELVEARWFTRAELRERDAAGKAGRIDSLDRVLMRTWLATG
ncbi:MAG: NAD(+) diphosphatase [Hamadaea sp.]|nr:NAD(+) diphosphatase [Hamadaea sp.]